MGKFNELINGSTPVLVDFYADWCGPCKMMAPILEEVKHQFREDVKIIKVDVDQNQAAAQKFGVRGVPTLILFQNGQQLWRQSGVVPSNELVELIRGRTSGAVS